MGNGTLIKSEDRSKSVAHFETFLDLAVKGEKSIAYTIWAPSPYGFGHPQGRYSFRLWESPSIKKYLLIDYCVPARLSMHDPYVSTDLQVRYGGIYTCTIVALVVPIALSGAQTPPPPPPPARILRRTSTSLDRTWVTGTASSFISLTVGLQLSWTPGTKEYSLICTYNRCASNQSQVALRSIIRNDSGEYCLIQSLLVLYIYPYILSFFISIVRYNFIVSFIDLLFFLPHISLLISEWHRKLESCPVSNRPDLTHRDETQRNAS